MYLELEGTIEAEAPSFLRRNRGAQRDLADIPGGPLYKRMPATRYRHLRGRVYRAKCPMMRRFHADSFLHVPGRYHLLDCAAEGPEAAPFLARVVSVTGRQRGSEPLHYLDALTAEARARDAAPVDAGEMRRMQQVVLGVGIADTK